MDFTTRISQKSVCIFFPRPAKIFGRSFVGRLLEMACMVNRLSSDSASIKIHWPLVIHFSFQRHFFSSAFETFTHVPSKKNERSIYYEWTWNSTWKSEFQVPPTFQEEYMRIIFKYVRITYRVNDVFFSYMIFELSFLLSRSI